jgi:hypothetical protein
MVAVLLAVAIAGAIVVSAMDPESAWGMALLVSIGVGGVLMLECLYLVLGGIGLGALFVLAARGSMALSVDTRGIELGALPLQWARLGRRHRDARAAEADRFIPWSQVSTVHLPDTTRAWSGLWSLAIRMLIGKSGNPDAGIARSLILRVHRQDGTDAQRVMRGVGYDAWSIAEAVRRFAPDVAVTVE